MPPKVLVATGRFRAVAVWKTSMSGNDGWQEMVFESLERDAMGEPIWVPVLRGENEAERKLQACSSLLLASLGVRLEEP